MLTINLRWAMRIKRVCISLTIALALLMTACSSNNDTTTVKDGTYVLKINLFFRKMNHQKWI